MKKLKRVEDLEELKKRIENRMDEAKKTIIISTKSTCCHLKGSREVTKAFEEEIEKNGLENEVEILRTGCLGDIQRYNNPCGLLSRKKRLLMVLSLPDVG